VLALLVKSDMTAASKLCVGILNAICYRTLGDAFFDTMGASSVTAEASKSLSVVGCFTIYFALSVSAGLSHSSHCCNAALAVSCTKRWCPAVSRSMPHWHRLYGLYGLRCCS
jgi:hypothetical protein